MNFSTLVESFSIKQEKEAGDCLLHLFSTYKTPRLMLLPLIYRSEN